MKKQLLFTFFAFSLIFSIKAQQNIREQVYIHLSSQQLITGETLYFKAYCNSRATGRPSILSKILYLELIGEQGVVHREKIQLVEGAGHGDFFVSSLISSGKYQLLAYTRWMKNFDDYNQSAIEIINPYEEYALTSNVIEKELNIDFYSSNDGIVQGIENTIAFRISPVSQNAKFKGKVINNEGETIINFDHDNLGLGKISFEPKPTKNYQVILEDKNGNLKFFDFPKFLPSGIILNIEEKSSHLSVSLVGSKGYSEALTIVALKGNSLLFETKSALNNSTIIPKSSLQEGMIILEVRDDDGNTIATRHYLNQKISLDNQALPDVYKTRSKVTINPKLLPGKYSVSVKRKNQHIENLHSHAILSEMNQNLSETLIGLEKYYSSTYSQDWELFFLTSKLKGSTKSPDSVRYIPEVREEILSGKIAVNNDIQARDMVLTMSFPEDSYQLRTTSVDKNGYFSIPFESMNSTIDAYLSTQDFNSNLEVSIDDPFLVSAPSFNYTLAPLDSIQIMEVVEKSIRNQLENAYYEAPMMNEKKSYWFPPVPYNDIYVLDEYTRFKTLKETFVEYIFSANFREKRDPVIKPMLEKLTQGKEYPPLILIDGLPVSGNKMIDFSPYKIASISIYNNRYFLGSLVADGVVNFKTKEKVLNGFLPDKSYTKIEIMKVSKAKEYDFKKYEEQTPSSLPDQRDQLFWNPNVIATEKESPSIQFFTSDIEGEFEIVIEGFTQEGKPVSILRTFKVEKPEKI